MIGTLACAAYGVATTETGCDDASRTCASCLECATGAQERGDGDDAVPCDNAFELCFGDDRDCSASDESSCCKFTTCRAACDDLHGPDSNAAWMCICGASGRGACNTEEPPEGTCAAEHPDGARQTLGPKGWETCAHAACATACND